MVKGVIVREAPEQRVRQGLPLGAAHAHRLGPPATLAAAQVVRSCLRRRMLGHRVNSRPPGREVPQGGLHQLLRQRAVTRPSRAEARHTDDTRARRAEQVPCLRCSGIHRSARLADQSQMPNGWCRL